MSPAVSGAGGPAARHDQADAIVVGARMAGSATAIALASAGRRVIAIDRAHFPSDTLSTHLLFSGGVQELHALGALERVEALGSPRMPRAEMTGNGITIEARYSGVDEIGEAGRIDYTLCVRRPGLDAALVETARAAGAEVREGVAAKELIRTGDRVVGVRAEDREGIATELRAPLIVGADGRHSSLARLLGVEDPYRSNANERGCCFAYWHDSRTELREIAAQYREGEELATAFPCDDGLVLVLLMPPVLRAAAFGADPQGEYERTVAQIPALVARLQGCERASKVRTTFETTSFFRRSSGPGWALVGDAGHFKDPVTAQGIRDALRFGRLLGELTAAALDDPLRLDNALADWERRRERECMETYQWTNRLARAEAMTGLEIELYREAARSPALGRQLLDVFGRSRAASDVFTPRLAATLALRAWRNRTGSRAEIARTIAGEIRQGLIERRERRTALGL